MDEAVVANGGHVVGDQATDPSRPVGVCVLCRVALYTFPGVIEDRVPNRHPIWCDRPPGTEYRLCGSCRSSVERGWLLVKARGFVSVSNPKEDVTGIVNDDACGVCARDNVRLLGCSRCTRSFCRRCFGNVLGEAQAPESQLSNDVMRWMTLHHVDKERLRVMGSEWTRRLHQSLWLCPGCRRESHLRDRVLALRRSLVSCGTMKDTSAEFQGRLRHDWDRWIAAETDPCFLGYRYKRVTATPRDANHRLGPEVLNRLFLSITEGAGTHAPFRGCRRVPVPSHHSAARQIHAHLPQRMREAYFYEPMRLRSEALEFFIQHAKEPPNHPEATLNAIERWHQTVYIISIILREWIAAANCGDTEKPLWVSGDDCESQRMQTALLHVLLQDCPLTTSDVVDSTENLCFLCKTRGEWNEKIVLCDVPGCCKAYHARCIGIGGAPHHDVFTPEGALSAGPGYQCPWHFDSRTGERIESVPLIANVDNDAQPFPLIGVFCTGIASTWTANDQADAIQCRTCSTAYCLSSLSPKEIDQLGLNAYRWAPDKFTCIPCRAFVYPPTFPFSSLSASTRGTPTTGNPPVGSEEKRSRGRAPGAPRTHAEFDRILSAAIQEGAQRIAKAKASGTANIIASRMGDRIDPLSEVREAYDTWERGNAGAVVAIMAVLKREAGRSFTMIELALEAIRQGLYLTQGKTPHLTFAAFFSSRRQRLRDQGLDRSWFQWTDKGRVCWNDDT